MSSEKTPFLQGWRQTGSYQGTTEVEVTQYDELPNKSHWTLLKPAPGGIATCSIVAVALVILGLVLIFGLTSNFQSKSSTISLRQQITQTDKDESESKNYRDVQIPRGRLRGYIKKSRQDRDFLAFYKVPYASPPLGKLRFKDPQPPTSWNGLRDISTVAPQCIQKERYPTPRGAAYAVGEEDCLYSNIYVPASATESLNQGLPVIICIHGGIVQGNASRYGAEYFMDEDVILITFQYRLGALGALTTGDGVIAGNMGFKDQVQLLRWVQENISHFGGDSKRVTIIGNSAGGGAVGYLMVSPMAANLFHRAITQSGAALCTSPNKLLFDSGKDALQDVAWALNCSPKNSTTFLECLQEKDAADIALVLGDMWIVRGPMYWLTVENVTNSIDGLSVFMPDTPYNLLSQGKANKVPYMLGNVNAEMLDNALSYLEDTELIQNLNSDFGGNGDIILPVADISGKDLTSIKEFYFGDKSIGNETLRELTEMISDKGHVYCTYQTAKLHSKLANTYLYWLTKPAAKSYVEKHHPGVSSEDLGMVNHGDELQFLFPYDEFPEIKNGDSKYFHFSNYLVKLWAHFAATGNPNFEGIGTAEIWKELSPEPTSTNVAWMELNDNPKMTSALLNRMQFWEQFTARQLLYI